MVVAGLQKRTTLVLSVDTKLFNIGDKMLLPNNLHPLIKEVIESDSLFEDFSVQAHTGNGMWVGLIDMKEWIHIELTLKENRVYAKVSANISGFSGVLESYEWCMPNDMLHRSIMQILTILEHLPREENINDLEWKVHTRWMNEHRKKRTEIKIKIRKEFDDTAKTLLDMNNWLARAKMPYITSVGEIPNIEAMIAKIVNNVYKYEYSSN